MEPGAHALWPALRPLVKGGLGWAAMCKLHVQRHCHVHCLQGASLPALPLCSLPPCSHPQPLHPAVGQSAVCSQRGIHDAAACPDAAARKPGEL